MVAEMKRKPTVFETLAVLGGCLLVAFTLLFWVEAGLEVFKHHLGLCTP